MDFELSNRLEVLLNAFRGQRLQDLKRLGNDFIEQAAQNNDSPLARLSVIAYSLYKMLSKDHFLRSPQWGTISQKIGTALLDAKTALEKNNRVAFDESLELAIKSISGLDRDLSNFAKNIYEKAKIKQASTAYAMGLSLRQAASLTGADSKELQKYIGSTRIHDEHPAGMGITARMEMLREILRK